MGNRIRQILPIPKFYHYTFIINSTIIPSYKKRRFNGTWVQSTSASVLLSTDINQPQLILTVSLDGTTFEEHYISKLNFLWPQGSRRVKSSLRGSRLIFACYKDSMDQIQKFAMRFSSSKECRKFVEMVKRVNAETEVNFSSNMPEIQKEQAGLGQAPVSTDPDAAASPGAPQSSPEISLKRFLMEGSEANKPLIDLLEKMDRIIIGLGGDLRLQYDSSDTEIFVELNQAKPQVSHSIPV